MKRIYITNQKKNADREKVGLVQFSKLLIVALTLAITGCTDLFETNTDDIINDADYISTNGEMYSGFLGVLTKLQAVGDKTIFLTDTRGDFIEPTQNAPEEVWDVYFYNNMQGNSIANPAEFYDLIIACNDYLDKMFQYKEEVGNNMSKVTEENFYGLISGALRIKSWTYLKLGLIYGEAVYFDDPISELVELKEGANFTKLNSLNEIAEKSLSLIDEGVNGINASYEMEWGNWLDPENPTSYTGFPKWSYMIPNYTLLRCEICLTLNQEYEWVREQTLQYLSEIFTENNNNFRLNDRTPGQHSKYFYTEYNKEETVSSIIYDYDNDQTNNLVKYFSNTYPAKYILRPTTYGMSKYADDDARGNGAYFASENGDTVMNKYHHSFSYSWVSSAYLDQATIPLYRGFDLHFMLAEAENHLGHWEQAKAILTNGVYGVFSTMVDTTLEGWDIRYQTFLTSGGIEGSVYKYPNTGIQGCLSANRTDFSSIDSLDIDAKTKAYDMALLDEALLEFAAEGRSYGMMIRMANRYNGDPKIISDRVCPKYESPEEIRSKIENETDGKFGYFVHYDLGL